MNLGNSTTNNIAGLPPRFTRNLAALAGGTITKAQSLKRLGFFALLDSETTT